MRSVSEWIGKTDEAKVPARVLLRIFEREGGICHLSGRKIQPGEKWQADHKIALCNGGEHRESNLFPALVDKHKEKTKADVAEKSRVAGRAKTHVIGRPKPVRPIQSRGFSPSSKAREPRAPLPPRALYVGTAG